MKKFSISPTKCVLFECAFILGSPTQKVAYPEIMSTSQKIVKALKLTYKPYGYSIMQNGGMCNDVGHYHLHIFPRYSGDGFGWTASEKQFDYSQEIAEKIANAIN